ncbi:MAG: competence protein CoiA family protein, partial [Gemmatimonadaceae bacterium]
RRPAAFCPQCDRRVTLKLGDVLRHHAAHASGDVCAATHPETALHLNCKFALAEALRAHAGPDARCSVIRRCSGAGQGSCDETLITPWMSAWDEVLVEHRVGDSRRPDIVLLRHGAPVGAVEVVVSNAVSVEKALVLADLGVPWAEVLGSSELAARDGWSPRDPLPVVRVAGEDAWRCATHAAQHRIALDARAEQDATLREAQRHASVQRAARVVDVYQPNGTRDRFIYRVVEQLTDGRVHALQLFRGRQALASEPVEPGDDPRTKAWPRLRDAFAADVERVARHEGSFTDSPMRWAAGGAAEYIVEEALMDRVGNDPTPLATRYPRRWFYAADRHEWFLPRDMRDVRWDRDPLDLFAAHPAWTANRSAVREHPAPQGSWQTPVFAGRPTATMFLPAPATRVDGDSIAVVDVAAPDERKNRRVIVVVERASPSEMIAALAASLHADATDAVWLSHPLDWSPAFAPLAWAAAGRDARDYGAVVIDGLGVFRASQFVRALARNDPRLTATAIRRWMSQRVERMREP